MNKFSFQKTFLFCCLVIVLPFAACKKDVAGKFEGTYIGEGVTYPAGPGVSHSYPNTRVEIIKLNTTTIRIEMISAGPEFTLTTERTLRKNGTFGDGIKGNRGSVILYGEEGKFSGDSFTYSFLRYDSTNLFIVCTFNGRRN